MGEYAELNRVYVSYFNFVNPPTRVCVQCPLPDDVAVILDAVAFKCSQSAQDADGVVAKERSTMHVQGISHWAPANIGPYSQAYKVGEVVGTCGQIALVPGAMKMLEGGGGRSARRETALALRHVSRVLRAAHSATSMRSALQGVCYVTQLSAVREARRQLERRTAAALVEYVVVEGLPRAAAVEWAVWAHTNYNCFDYEETGCNVGDYKVALTRRWNYDNTVSAFLCYVGTASSPSSCRLTFANEDACNHHKALAAQMSAEELQEVFLYSIKKLLNDCQDKIPDPAISLRVFYQFWSAPPVDRILEALESVCGDVTPSVVYCAVPVVALHSAFTFMSISGYRIDE